MYIPETKMPLPIFPGSIATLKVDIQTNFNQPQSFFLTKIWNFYNTEQNPNSLINRIEVWKDCVEIAFIDIFFKKTGCEELLKTFSDKINTQFMHDVEQDSCRLRITDHQEIKNVLSLINSSQAFDANSQNEMNLILSQL